MFYLNNIILYIVYRMHAVGIIQEEHFDNRRPSRLLLNVLMDDNNNEIQRINSKSITL